MSSESHHFTLRIPKHPMVLLVGLGTVGGVVWGIESFWPLVTEVMTAFNGLKGDPVKLSETFRNIIWGWSALGAAIIGLGGLALGFWRGMALHTQALAQKDQAASALKNSEAALKNAEITEKGQMAEAFAKAIEQLGDAENMSIRIGGILALEKIAKTDPKGYHDQVFETLCAFVREKAAWTEEKEKENENPNRNIRPLQDIQLILTVIGRRESEIDGRKLLIDLRESDLRGADLVGAHLENAFLNGTHFEDAKLEKARLNNAVLWFSRLERANLSRAHLEGADLSLARCEHANFEEAYLEETDLWFAELKDATLKGVHLRTMDLEWANLTGADLKGADLSQARNLPEDTLDVAKWDKDTIWPPGFDEDDGDDDDSENSSGGMGETESPP